ncbi:MAG: GAF domain-containing protein [Chloroflexota bacterium]
MNYLRDRGIKFTQSVGFKLLLSFNVVMLVLTGLLTGLEIRNDRELAELEESHRLADLYTSYNLDIRNLESEAAALAVSVADRPDVKDLLLQQDREGLLALLTPVFTELKSQHNIVHLYVESPDGTVFVRVHNPSQFGDDITYRRTVAETLETQQTVAGVEIGPNRLGVRGVSPMFANGEFIGMIEVGLDFDQPFIEALKELTAADYHLWVTYDAAAPAALKPQEGALASPSDKFFHYAGTQSALLSIPEDVYLRVLASGDAEVQYATASGGEYAVLVAPLLAYGDRPIGILEIIYSRADLLADIRTDTRNGILTALLIGLVGITTTWIIARSQVVRPIVQLSETADRQAQGDLSARSSLNRNDEFGHLGQILDGLSEKLAETIQQLEFRIAERTRDLESANAASTRRARQFEAVSQVAGSIASVRSLDELLPRIAQLISEKFNFYHVGIFLTDDSNQYAILSAANSEGGKRMLARRHQLKVGSQGIVGYVTGTGHARVALNTGEDAVYFNNPDLPNTRSEMALPLIISGRPIGALDVQSLEPNAFSSDDIEVLTTLANQVSTAIQNARSFLEARRLLAEAQSIVTGYIAESWKVLRPASLATGYEKSGGTIQQLQGTLAGPHIQDALEQGNTVTDACKLAVPIRLRGQIIGILNMQIPDDQRWSTNEVRIAEAVAERLSLAIETAILIKATQRRANIERITADITGKIGSSTHLETILQTAAQELSRALGGSEVLVQIEPVAMKLSTSG